MVCIHFSERQYTEEWSSYTYNESRNPGDREDWRTEEVVLDECEVSVKNTRRDHITLTRNKHNFGGCNQVVLGSGSLMLEKAHLI